MLLAVLWHQTEKMEGGFFLFLGESHPPRKQLKPTTGLIGIYPEEQFLICPVVTEILRDGRTDRHIICVIDNPPVIMYFFSLQQQILCKGYKVFHNVIFVVGNSNSWLPGNQLGNINNKGSRYIQRQIQREREKIPRDC